MGPSENETPPDKAVNVAMAYPRTGTTAKPAVTPALTRAWEDYRKEARKLESELDARMAAFAKLCTSYDSGYGTRGEVGLVTDQHAQSKAGEMEELLARLSDVNEGMSSSLSGTNDSRSHIVARHRDILHDLNQEFRRLKATLGAAQDRANLLAGSNPEAASLLGSQGNASLLLRERGSVQNANASLDDVMGQASAISGNLGEQRRVFEGVGSKLLHIGSKMPMVNGVLNAIRRKKNKDTIILAAVIAACTLFTLVYWWNK